MEELINNFMLVTEGPQLPAGEAFLAAKKREWSQFVNMVQAFVDPKA